MKVLLRADASADQGTGHVMRCLSLGQELKFRGHEVTLLTNASNLAWLEAEIRSSGLAFTLVEQHSLEPNALLPREADVLVVDSYEIPAEKITAAREVMKVLAIVDGSTRGIQADLYLDQNLGAEQIDWGEDISNRMLAGSKFALVRDAILRQKRSYPWLLEDGVASLVAFMGGSDPSGTMREVTRAILNLRGEFNATLIVRPEWMAEVSEMVGQSSSITVMEPTQELPALLGAANVVVSASGTSAWELCTLGLPSILLAVAENQVDSLKNFQAADLGLGLNLVGECNLAVSRKISQSMQRLIQSEVLREQLSRRCTNLFDGRGKQRVANAIEELTNTSGVWD